MPTHCPKPPLRPNPHRVELAAWIAVALAAACGCTRPREEPQPVIPPAPAAASSSVTPSIGLTQPQPSALVSAAPSTAALAVVPLLDDAKGSRALAAYRAVLSKACSGGSAALAGLGLDLEGDDGSQQGVFCSGVGQSGRALASGALLEAGSDEVLLQSWSGRSAAGGDSTLALMRRDGERYQLVKHLVYGAGWRPRIRVATPSGRDALLLCEEGGRMGLYTGTCGFLDDLGSRPGADRGIPTVFATACGPQESVSVGSIEFRDNRLYAPLFLERSVLEPGGPEEVPGGPYCSRKVRTSRKMFTIEYRFDGERFRRVTPIPKEVDEVLAGY